MRKLIYSMICACIFFACSEKKDFSVTRDTVLVTEGVEKTKEGYMKALAGKWKVDTASARKEITLMTDAVTDKVAAEKGDKEWGVKAKELMAHMADGWVTEMGDWHMELKPDGTRISQEGSPEPVESKFDFNSTLDTMYIKSKTGEIRYRFKLKTVSPDSLVYLRFMPIQDGDTTSFIRYRYIRM